MKKRIKSLKKRKDPFYIVDEFVSTLKEGESFTTAKAFIPDAKIAPGVGDYVENDIVLCKTLLDARNKAIEYYEGRMKGLQNDTITFIKPLADPITFKHGEHSAYSCNLILAFINEKNDIEEYVLTDDSAIPEARKMEYNMLQEAGFTEAKMLVLE